MRKLTTRCVSQRTLEQPGDNPLREAHRARFRRSRCHGMADDVDTPAFLLDLNLACASEDQAGEKITPPGLPLVSEKQDAFFTDDCLRAPML
jgi:hypothetical protein